MINQITKIGLKNRLFALTLISLGIMGLGCSSSSSDAPAPPAATPLTLNRISFVGVGVSGIFDPSLTYDVENSKLWMSYSDVNRSALYPTDNPDAIQTRVASSDDLGATWTDAGSNINAFKDVSLGSPFPTVEGTWMNETSSLVYDKSAVAAERWKLISHVYLMYKNSRLFEHGWIEYKQASTPVGLASATPIKLFGAANYNSGNDSLDNTATRSPVGGAPSIMLNTFHTDLNACAVFAEGSLYSTDTALYMSLICFTGTDNRVFLMKCLGPCDVTNTASWSYLGTVITNSDAAVLGYARFSASELFEYKNSVYLAVTPVSDSPVTNAYNGCVFFNLLDLDAGTINLTPVKKIEGTSGSFNGACTFEEMATKSGVIYSEIDDILGTKEFRIFQGTDFL